MTYGVNAPFGLQSIITNSSSTLSGQNIPFSIASGYGTALFAGDPVTFLSNGTIGICPPGQAAIGVLDQVTFIDTLGNYNNQSYWPAGQVTLNAAPAIASIISDSNVIYNIQASTSLNVASPTVTAAQVGQYANFAIGGGGANLGPNLNPTSGNTRTGLSGYYLDVSTISPNASLSLRIVGFTQSIINAPSLPFNNVLVTLNNNLLTNTGNNFPLVSTGQVTTISGATAAYTALLSDEVIEVSNSAATAVTITLPTATATPFLSKGKQYIIKDTGNASTMNITISAATGNVDGGSAMITTRYGHVRVMWDGTQWWTI